MSFFQAIKSYLHDYKITPFGHFSILNQMVREFSGRNFGLVIDP
jgi:hypothetical protein